MKPCVTTEEAYDIIRKHAPKVRVMEVGVVASSCCLLLFKRLVVVCSLVSACSYLLPAMQVVCDFYKEQQVRGGCSCVQRQQQQQQYQRQQHNATNASTNCFLGDLPNLTTTTTSSATCAQRYLPISSAAAKFKKPNNSSTITTFAKPNPLPPKVESDSVPGFSRISSDDFEEPPLWNFK